MTTYRPIKNIAATVRTSLKIALPEWKFSVVTRDNSIIVSLMSGPGHAIECYANGEECPDKSHAQLNHYTFLHGGQFSVDKQERKSNGYKLTPMGMRVFDTAAHILAAEHWDESDISTDYFRCAFYMHLQVGKWDKSFTVK